MSRPAAMASTPTDNERGDLMAAKYRTPFRDADGELTLVGEAEARGLEADGIKVTEVRAKADKPEEGTEGKS